MFKKYFRNRKLRKIQNSVEYRKFLIECSSITGDTASMVTAYVFGKIMEHDDLDDVNIWVTYKRGEESKYTADIYKDEAQCEYLAPGHVIHFWKIR